jgi:ferrous iron transport protein B
MPCNGRFPTVILLIGILLGKIYSSFAAALLLTLFILLSITVTFIATKILNKFLKGDNLTFDIELTSYKFPPILKTFADSFVNKALHILGRAVIVSAPAGAILWLLSNITVNNLSLLTFLADFLSPLGALMAMDGVILLSFILGSPANEIVLPIAAMIYLSDSHLTGIGNNEMVNVFINNGWNGITALSVIIFSLFHWPCTTTLLTIKKETNSLKYTFLSVILPTVIGSVLCIIINLISSIYTGF